jgi:hypothetical protein
MLFIIYFMIKQLRLLIKLKWSYLKQFWSLIELGLIICSWMIVQIWISQHKEFNRIESLFKQTNGYVYINFQFASYVNDILIFLFSFCCFFGTLKFLHLCRFNQRLLLFNLTLQYAAKAILSFSIMFSIIFMSFLCLFYLLFNSKLWSCSCLLQTSEMIFQMMSLRYKTSQLTDAATFLGPFCFSLFIFLVVFICLNMFMSIVNDSFRHVRQNVPDNQEIISFMLTKFQRWIGK